MNKYTKILNGASGTYPRSIESFIGLDCATDAGMISARRMARCVNMWRDYESENGGAIETVPGWRQLFSATTQCIYGLFGYRGADGVEYFVIHSGADLFNIPVSALENIGSANELMKYRVGVLQRTPSAFFESGGKCYVLDGTGYYYIGSKTETSAGLHPVTESAYEPVTYFNGEPYEQRNMLTPNFIERYTVDRSANKQLSTDLVWKYRLVTDGGADPYLKLVGIADGYTADELIYAHIPEKAVYEGKSYPILGFDVNFFDLLTYTEQLVVEAALDLFGLSGAGNALRGRQSGAISGMVSLQRLVLRNPDAKYEFNACDSFISEDNSYHTEPTVPLRELWLAGVERSGYDVTNTHEYSDRSVGITSAYTGKVKLYVEVARPDDGSEAMWYNGYPKNTETEYGVHFMESRLGKSRTFTEFPKLVTEGGAKVDVDVGSGNYNVIFDSFYAYSHVHFKVGGTNYCALVRDGDTGATCEERGKWYEYTVYEPFKKVINVRVDNGIPGKYKENAYTGKVAVLHTPSHMGGALEIKLEGYPNRFSTVEKLTAVKNCTADVINKCTIACAYDGRVFFTGNPELPNTVFYSGRGLNGENDPSYIGIYNYFNDGIGNVPNTAMVSNASMLVVLKGESSTDACAYYHTAQYNGDPDTADLIPRIYPCTQGISNIPCVGEACNFSDDIVFLSPSGLEGVEKQTLNLERTLSHRSGRVDPILRRGLSSDSRMVEWKGYLCILNSDGTMLLADSRAVSQNEATGEAQYEWFMLEGVGAYSGDKPKWIYADGTIALVNADGEEVNLPLDALTVTYGEKKYPMRIGVGEKEGGAPVISFGTVEDAEGNMYTFDGGLNAEVRADCSCPVLKSGEMIGGMFRPATAIVEFRGKLYFGTSYGQICVFNTDKRGISYDNGETPSVIDSRWYDRCGHRYESGFSTLFDDCGYPQFAKSTVGKTLTIRAKRMPDSTFTLAARSEREDWRDIEAFTVTDSSFYRVDFANFSFEDRERGIFSSCEKMKRWGEKQMYFYSDGFRSPFGIYGVSYCYSFAGRLR